MKESEVLDKLYKERDSIKDSLASLRDQFAMSALPGILSGVPIEIPELINEEYLAIKVSRLSYLIADKMIIQRNKY